MQEQLDQAYKNVHFCQTQNTLTNHTKSYSDSLFDAKYTFNEYMENFMALNRDLRTDCSGITTILDNVPCSFALPSANAMSFYQFAVNLDLNLKGSMKVYF